MPHPSKPYIKFSYSLFLSLVKWYNKFEVQKVNQVNTFTWIFYGVQVIVDGFNWLNLRRRSATARTNLCDANEADNSHDQPYTLRRDS